MIALGQLAKPGELVTAERRTRSGWFGHAKIVVLLCFDLGRPNDLGPFLRFIVHELAELGV